MGGGMWGTVEDSNGSQNTRGTPAKWEGSKSSRSCEAATSEHAKFSQCSRSARTLRACCQEKSLRIFLSIFWRMRNLWIDRSKVMLCGGFGGVEGVRESGTTAPNFSEGIVIADAREKILTLGVSEL